jgi:hypothetical protein
VLLIGIGLMTIAGFAGLREDELECEEAVAHLQKCCPDFHVPPDYCQYKSGPACGETTLPALSIRDSHCVQDKDCQGLADAYLCQEAAGREPVVLNSIDGVTTDTREPLCE